MATKMKIYDYTQEKHEAWVRQLEEKFGESHVDDHFHWTNTIIEVKVVKSENCTLILTLDFGRSQPRKEHGNILCIYGSLTQIRSFIAHNVDGWDNAITMFENMVETLDFSSLEAVKSQFKSL